MTILTNPDFYPHYEVWISRAPLFGQMGGDDSPYAMLNWHCSGKPSKTPLDRHKHQGPLSSLLFLNLYNLYPSHMNLHLPKIAVIIGFLCSSILRATAEVIGLGSPCIHGSHPRKTSRQKIRKVYRLMGCSLYSVYFESPPLLCWSVLLPPSLPYPLHAF